MLAHALMNERQREEFAQASWSATSPFPSPALSRFRVNVFVQQQQVGMVIRTIASEIPTFEKLGLPDDAEGNRDDQARASCWSSARTGSGQVDLARGDDRPSQPHVVGSYHHGRGSGRVRAPAKNVAGHPPRGRRRHALLAQRAEEHVAPGAGRHPDRRDSRHGDDGARHRLRRDRASVPRHAARQQREPDARSHHQLLPRGAARRSC